MRSLLVMLEDLVGTEFGPAELATIRAESAKRSESGETSSDTLATKAASFLRAVSQVRRRPVSEVHTWVGARLTPQVLKELTLLTRGHTTARALIMQINAVAQPLTDALLPGERAPEFDLELLDQDSVRLSFLSGPDTVCIVEGALKGVGLLYGERVDTVRTAPPSYALPERRLLTVKFQPERRTTVAPAPAGVERRRLF